jgi:DNA-binding beta-propeller fold protein YncE
MSSWGRRKQRLVTCLLCSVCLTLMWAGASGASSPLSVSSSTRTFAGSLSKHQLDGAQLTQVGPSSPLSGALVIFGTPNESEQLRAQQEARRSTPQAFAMREASQLAYTHLDGAQAKQLAAAAFPELIEEPAGGSPKLPAGEEVSNYESDYTAQVDLPEHRHGVIESVAPIARETSPGHRSPIDLHLSEAGGHFQPTTPVVALSVPKQIDSGVQLGRTGVSITPVDDSGSPLSAPAGEVEGAGVMYPNTLPDADTLVKPTTLGVSLETLLRSADSPRELYFRVDMPSGARLVAAGAGTGEAEVVDNGSVIATIAAPSAQDAEGTPVPISMAIHGAVLALTVPESSQYRLPIAVDPTVTDSIWQNEYYYSTYYRTEWYFWHNGSAFSAPEQPEGGKWTENISSAHKEGEYGGLFYTTRGVSQITVAHVEGEWSNTGAHIQNTVLLQTPNYPYTEDYDLLPEATEPGWGFGGYACAPSVGCPETTVGPAPPANNNTAGFEQYSLAAGSAATDTATGAYVTISQEQGPELAFNTTSPVIKNTQTGEEVPNVLYGSGAWLGPHSGAFEVRAEDHGLGLKEYRVLTSGWGDQKFYYAEGECFGVQCPEYNRQGYTYKTGMQDGEPGFEALAVDPVGLYAHIEPYNQKIKVDGTPPHAIKVTGLQNGSELPLGEAHLKVEATDGSGTTKSSGVKSIKVTVDGHEVSGTAASCPVGPCSASTEFTLAARNYSSGKHALIVSATDGANNLAQEEFTFIVHGASPVSVGPASVDPSTGQVTLSASDVAAGGGIGVSRTYQSREPNTGAEGPLGPQWAINLGGDESLTVMLNGDAVLSASGGANTTFIRKSNGEFESPPGDTNLKLEAKEKEPGKGITEYVLSNEKAATKTKFEQPAGAQSATPTFANQFGFEAGQLSHPLSAAIDPGGNLWTTNSQSNLIEKYSPTGTLLGSYGSYGTGNGQFSGPWGIAVDPRNGNVYVADQGNFRVQELSSSGAFIKAFGWGVSNGEAALQTCTTECRAGIAGAANGQFSWLAGLAVDSSGNLWVADYGNNRIQEFNEKSEFVRKFGSLGKGAEQFEGPLNIALSGGNLYITDYKNNRVQEFSATGAPIARFGAAGSGSGQFTNPYGIAADPRSGNLYVVDSGNARVEEFTPAGAFITKFGSAGSGPGQLSVPTGVAVGASGGVYVLDNSTNRVEQWTRSVWVPSEAGGPLSASSTTFAYKTVEREGKAVIEPSEALSPVPAGVSCGTKVEELKRGCRALTFNYAESTTATGENESQWGDYKGNLTRVYYHAWDPAKGTMSEPVVAQYLYDNKGRLRAEWDPRISPALKTVYGYDAEGHLTAVGPPGQQPWLLNYGTIEGDASPGRLLAVTRPSASTSLGSGVAPSNTSAPTLSTSKPIIGTAMSVSTGSWSNSPLSFSYQWLSCKVVKTQGEIRFDLCEPIPGAVNPTYTPLARDRGRELAANVTATNRAGSTLICAASGTSQCSYKPTEVVSGTSELSKEPAPNPPEVGSSSVSTLEYGVPTSGTGLPSLTVGEAAKWGQTDDPVEGVAIFPPDEPMGWPAKDYKRATIHYWDGQGRMVNTALPTGGIATSEYNEANDIVRTLSADNRAASLNEGAKSAEMSKLLDTRSAYSANGTQLLETRGPQHAVKLASGAVVQARNHVRYFYDEGAPGGQTYNLLTKTTDGAEYEGKEADVRTTLNAYSGQENLGWKLRKPTSTTTDPAGLNLVHKTIYDPTTGNVVETRSPGGNSETIYPPAFASTFASEGSGNGQLNRPEGTAIDSSGNVWVADFYNGRVEKFSPSGTFLATYGTWGTGNLQFREPNGVAISQSTGNVYVADTTNNRIEELNASGAYVTSFGTSGSGALSGPIGVAVDSSGNLWVGDHGHNRLVEYSGSGVFIREVGTVGSGNGQLSGPEGVAISEGSIYVADTGNYRVEQFSSLGAYLGQFGAKGSGAGKFEGPAWIAANPSSGNLYVSDTASHRVEEWSPAGRFLTEWSTWGPTHELSFPVGIAISATGTPYVADKWGAKVSTWAPPEASAAHLISGSPYGSSGSGGGQLKYPHGVAIDGEGNAWVADSGNNRIEKFSAKGSFIAAYGKEGSGNGEFKNPWAIDVNQSTGNVYISDANNHRVQELSSSGAFIRAFGTEGSGKLAEPGGLKVDSAGNVWVPDMSADKLIEYSSTGTFIAAYGKEGSGQVEFKRPSAIALSGENVYVTDTNNHRVQELSNKGAYIRSFGINGSGSGELKEPEGIAVDSAGNLYVVDEPSGHVEEFSSTGAYRATFGTPGSGEGQLKDPTGDAIDAAGNLYVADTLNNRIAKWTNSNQAVHDTRTVYYSVAANSEYPSCGGHAEWANMPCQTLPAAQPNTPGISNLPVTSVTYTMWSVPETITEAFGSTTRTKKETFDAAGRALTSEVSSSANTPLPKVTNGYNEGTGALETQSTTSEGKTKTITSVDNKLGQIEKYTDADGVTSTYAHDVDGRVQEVNYGTVDGETASQIYSYDATKGTLASLYDTAVGTLTAKYDVEAKMTSESYPNGMTATYTRNQAGESTGVEYVKTTHCSEKCTWFSEAVTPSIHGEALKQTSTLAEVLSQTDAAGRLTQVQETPAGKGCTTRQYEYDEEGDRTSLTTRQPGSEGQCVSEGGVREAHSYDPADRLSDTGVGYDAFGDITVLPAADAGGHELKSSYYVDSQVASQEQEQEGKAKAINFLYDSVGRKRETLATGQSAVISHYAGPGEALIWTSEGSAIWSRNIPGLDGTLCATQASGQGPVLQLHDLQGNIVATASLSETETKLLSSYSSTEFGVPQSGTTAPKYAWLGASGISSELPSSGVVTTGASSYVPEIGRALQSESVASPGAFPDGTGGGGIVQATYLQAAADQFKAIAIEHEAALEAAARQEAEERALLEACPASECGPFPEEGGAGEVGAEVDPEGILTGKGALRLAQQFEGESYAIDAELAAGGCLHNAACEADLETDKELLGLAAEKLGECYEAVHNGRWKNGVYQTGVCYYHYTHREEWGHTIVNLFSTEACWSNPTATGDTQAWYCPRHGGWTF